MSRRATGETQPKVRDRVVRAWPVLGGIVVGILLFSKMALKQEDFRPGDVGLGLNTTSREGEHLGRQTTFPTVIPHPLERLRTAISDVRKDGYSPVLWMGNSQLHGINHYESGDQIAGEYANDAARDRGSQRFYFQWSTPMASFHDMLAMYLYQRRSNTLPDVLVLAVTYNHLREETLKFRALGSAPDHEVCRIGGPGTEQLGTLVEGLTAAVAAPSAVERNAITGTPQSLLETVLTGWLRNAWSAYQYRGQLSAAIEVMTKTTISRFTSDASMRRVPSVPTHAQAWNRRALESIIMMCEADGIDILLYRAPFQPGMLDSYYDDVSDYQRFHEELRASCDERGIQYVDLESIVPQEYWGMTNEGRPDCFHFRAEGHKILGDTIDSLVARNADWIEHAIQ
jgi:hypothetical protein